MNTTSNLITKKAKEILLNFSKDSKVNLFVDANLEGLVPYLEKVGFKNVYQFNNELEDEEIHLYMQKLRKKSKSNKPNILITTNDKDFINFKYTNDLNKYSVLSVPSGLDFSKISNKIGTKLNRYRSYFNDGVILNINKLK